MPKSHDLTERDHPFVSLMRVCDWTRPQSWYVLLGRGLEFGTLCAILDYLFLVHVLGSPTGRLDAATLSIVFPMAAVLVLSVVLMVTAVISAASRGPANPLQGMSRPPSAGADLIGDAAIRLIWFATVALPLLVVHRVFLDPTNSISGIVVAMTFLVAVSASRGMLPRLLRRLCPPRPDAAS